MKISLFKIFFVILFYLRWSVLQKTAVVVGSVRKTLYLRCSTWFWMRLLVPQRFRVDTLFWNLQLHQSFSCWTSNFSEGVANSKYPKIFELFFCNWHRPQYFAEFCEKLIMVKTHCTHTLLRRIPLWCGFSNWILAKVTLIGWMMLIMRCFLKILFERWKIHVGCNRKKPCKLCILNISETLFILP